MLSARPFAPRLAAGRTVAHEGSRSRGATVFYSPRSANLLDGSVTGLAGVVLHASSLLLGRQSRQDACTTKSGSKLRYVFSVRGLALFAAKGSQDTRQLSDARRWVASDRARGKKCLSPFRGR